VRLNLLARRRTLTVAEFVAVSGLSQQAARRRLRSGQLRGYRLKGGRGPWRVYASELRKTGRG